MARTDHGRFLATAMLVSAAIASCSEVLLPGSSASGSATGSGGAGTTTSGSVASSASASSSGGDGGGGPFMCNLRALFEGTVQSDIAAECGACHGGSASPDALLADPDVYASVSSYPGVLTADPAVSRLFHASDPAHGGGQAPAMSSKLKAEVLAWLAQEAAHIPASTSPSPVLPPVKPRPDGVTTVVPLDTLGPTFGGTSLSFVRLANVPSGALVLDQIHADVPLDAELHVVHPRFVVHAPCGGSAPDDDDELAGVDQIVTSPVQPIGPGHAMVAPWQADGWLEIAFDAADETQGGMIDCKALATFVSDVVPQMQACADQCHAGASAQATAAMSLVGLDLPSPTDACASVRAHIVPGDPMSSQVVIVTNPSSPAVHLYKFAGNTSAYHAFVNAISPWILAEL